MSLRALFVSLETNVAITANASNQTIFLKTSPEKTLNVRRRNMTTKGVETQLLSTSEFITNIINHLRLRLSTVNGNDRRNVL